MTHTMTGRGPASWRLLCMLDNGGMRCATARVLDSQNAPDQALTDLAALNDVIFYRGARRVPRRHVETLDVRDPALMVKLSPSGLQLAQSPMNKVRRWLNHRNPVNVTVATALYVTDATKQDLAALVEAGHLDLFHAELDTPLRWSDIELIEPENIKIRLTPVGKRFCPQGGYA